MSKMTENNQNDLPLFTRSLAAACLAVVSVFSGWSIAQENEEVIRVDTDLVAFDVAVNDKNGKPVTNLRAEDFRIFEDGIERRIDFFQPIKRHDESRPL